MKYVIQFPPRGGGQGYREKGPHREWSSGDSLGPDWDYKIGGLLLGRRLRRLLGRLDNRHFVTIAGNRSGKTLTLIIPNLLRYPGSVVVIDPKGELAAATAKARAAMGQRVFVLAPFNTNGGNGLPPSAHYNPYDELKYSVPENLVADVAQLADAQIFGNKQDPHWTDAAKNLMIGETLLHHLYGRATLRNIRKAITDPRQTIETWHAMAKSDAFNGSLRSIGKTFLGKLGSDDGGSGFSNKELQSILSVTQEQTRPLDDVAHISERSDFSFTDFARRPTTVYLVLPGLRIETHARWLRMVIYQLLASLERNPIVVDRKRGQHPLWLVLEEFAALGHMRAIESAAGYIAGFGVQMWVILQDLTQIRTHYPQSWETFLGNAGVLNAFNVTDATTTQYLSQLLGTHTILERRNTRLSVAAISSGHPGFEESPRQVPLLEPSEITFHFARETGRQLVIVPGELPVHMERLPYA